MVEYGNVDALIKANYEAGQLVEKLMSYPILKETLGDTYQFDWKLEKLIDCYNKAVEISNNLELYRKSLLEK